MTDVEDTIKVDGSHTSVARKLKPGEFWAMAFPKVLGSKYPDAEFVDGVTKATERFRGIFRATPTACIVGADLRDLVSQNFGELTKIIPRWDDTQNLRGPHLYFTTNSEDRIPIAPSEVVTIQSVEDRRERSQPRPSGANMGLPKVWREFCKPCGYSHRVTLKDCPECQGRSGQQIICPVSEGVERWCKRTDYACDGCLEYRDHLH